MSSNGELGDLLKEAFPDKEITPPPPPAEVQEFRLWKRRNFKGNPDIRPLDVRNPRNVSRLALKILCYLIRNWLRKCLVLGSRVTIDVLLSCGSEEQASCSVFYFTRFQQFIIYPMD
ncbi:MAG: hypothetical protein Ct9H300mP28_10440 [Pseudomonadota bacterium]|nr:MAG: hypothetical protein Ct9H300mP28_10440 [Pseudomonadota bacterium]